MKYKTCNCCGEGPDLSYFGKDSNRKDGKRYVCQECDRVKRNSDRTSRLKMNKALLLKICKLCCKTLIKGNLW